MRSFMLLTALAVFAFISCNNPSGQSSFDKDTTAAATHALDTTPVVVDDSVMVGNWYRFTIDYGYSEFEIDPQYVHVFSDKMGYSKLKYTIENDTFKYYDIDYAARILPRGKDILELHGKNDVVVLTRWDESRGAFQSAPDQTDPAFEAYLQQFLQRAEQAWGESGYGMQ